MVHSGCNGGKRWRIHVYEKMGPVETKIFDTKTKACEEWGRSSKECTGGLRPQKAVHLIEDFLYHHHTFDYEVHAIEVLKKWFSGESIGRGLRKISDVLNQPLVYKDEKK